jgi:hypothetical protein
MCASHLKYRLTASQGLTALLLLLLLVVLTLQVLLVLEVLLLLLLLLILVFNTLFLPLPQSMLLLQQRWARLLRHCCWGCLPLHRLVRPLLLLVYVLLLLLLPSHVLQDNTHMLAVSTTPKHRRHAALIALHREVYHLQLPASQLPAKQSNASFGWESNSEEEAVVPWLCCRQCICHRCGHCGHCGSCRHQTPAAGHTLLAQQPGAQQIVYVVTHLFCCYSDLRQQL